MVHFYDDVINFIESKYQIQTRNYKPSLDGYRDFWGWVTEHCNVVRPCLIYLPKDWKTASEKDSPWWVKEIMTLITTEFFFGTSDLKLWVTL